MGSSGRCPLAKACPLAHSEKELTTWNRWLQRSLGRKSAPGRSADANPARKVAQEEEDVSHEEGAMLNSALATKMVVSGKGPEGEGRLVVELDFVPDLVSDCVNARHSASSCCSRLRRSRWTGASCVKHATLLTVLESSFKRTSNHPIIWPQQEGSLPTKLTV